MILSLGSAAANVADAKASNKEANRMFVALFIFSRYFMSLAAAGNALSVSRPAPNSQAPLRKARRLRFAAAKFDSFSTTIS